MNGVGQAHRGKRIRAKKKKLTLSEVTKCEEMVGSRSPGRRPEKRVR